MDHMCPAESWRGIGGGMGQSTAREEGARPEKRRWKTQTTDLSLMAESGQVWEHAPEQHVAASTFRRYSRGLRLAIPQADAWPIPISLRCRSTSCNHEARGRLIGLLHSRDSLADQHQENEPHVRTAAADAHGLCTEQISFESLSATARWTQNPTSDSQGFSEETWYQRN